VSPTGSAGIEPCHPLAWRQHQIRILIMKNMAVFDIVQVLEADSYLLNHNRGGRKCGAVALHTSCQQEGRLTPSTPHGQGVNRVFDVPEYTSN
jgi:hypothetical protein